MKHTKETKMELAYNYVRDKIDCGEFPPNMKITKAGICQELGLSRTPVREAVQKLIAEEYLQFTPKLGLTVHTANLQDLIEVYEVRETLEGVAVRLFCERCTPSLIETLKELIKKQISAFEKYDYTAFMGYDMEFHHTIFLHCGNKRLYDCLTTIYNIINRVAFVNKEDSELDELALQHHLDIYKYLVASNSEKAASAAESHVRDLKKYYLKSAYGLKTI